MMMLKSSNNNNSNNIYDIHNNDAGNDSLKTGNEERHDKLIEKVITMMIKRTQIKLTVIICIIITITLLITIV